MFAIVEAGRFLYGDILVDMIASVVYPEADLRLKGGLYRDPTSQIATFWGIAGGMSITTFLLIFMFMLLFVSFVHIPLPYEICDRQKVQFFELLLRVSNEYLGNLLEPIIGPNLRNKLTRFFAGIPYWFQTGTPRWCSVKDELIDGVPCRVYLPVQSHRRSDSLVVFIHGGGWCIMRPRYYDGPMLSLIRRTGCPVVSIDYDLSPEKQFPHAIQQCERVIKELYDRKYVEYNVNREKIALMGDSAGGNLTAVLCQRLLREGKGSIIKTQILVYPVIHMLDFLAPSYQHYYSEYKGTALLNPFSLARWYLMYVGIEPTRKNVKLMLKNQHLHKGLYNAIDYYNLTDHDHLPLALTDRSWYKRHPTSSPDPKLSEKFMKILQNPDINPIVTKDLSELPPAMIMTAGIDILRDEGVHYARRLKECGVQTRWNHYESAFHGVMNLPRSKQRKQMLDDVHSHLMELKLL